MFLSELGLFPERKKTKLSSYNVLGHIPNTLRSVGAKGVYQSFSPIVGPCHSSLSSWQIYSSHFYCSALFEHEENKLRNISKGRNCCCCQMMKITVSGEGMDGFKNSS